MEILYKQIGETPTQMINNYIIEYNSKNENKIKKGTVVGKLDPMACGQSICLFDEHCKKMNEYLNLKKVYEFKIIFGFDTDTNDILGLINSYEELNNLNEDMLNKNLKSFIGNYNQLYHNYSSICVKHELTGKRNPLWFWTKNNKLKEITIPYKNVNVDNLELLNLENIEFDNIKRKINKYIEKLEGDFRQKEILKKWNNINNINNVFVGYFKITCSSGFYVRQLVKELTKKINILGIAYEIERIEVIM